ITALSGNSRFNIPNPHFPPTDVMWRTQYISTHVAEGNFSDTLFRALPEAGSLVFRSSHDPDALYMHFIGKHGIPLSGAKAHHQGDATSFSLMANGELLAVDPGYPGYQESSAVNNASNHSLILVNGFGPLPPVGEAVSIATNTCWIEHFFDTPLLDYGEIRTNYFNADISRKNLFVRNRYFILADVITSPDTNTYTFQLQGNGLIGGAPGTPEGAFTPNFTNQQGTWSRDSTQLLVHTIAAGGAANYSNALDSLATGTNNYRYYSKMLVRKEEVSNTGFLSVLFPYSDIPPVVTTLTAASEVSAIRIEEGNFTDLVFAQQDSGMVLFPASVSGLPETVRANGTLNLIEYNPLYPYQLFLGNGDTMHVGSQYYIVCAHRMDVAYEVESDVVRSGYVSDSGWVGLYVFAPNYFQPTSGNILEYYPDQTNLLLWVRFATATTFTIELAEGLEDHLQAGEKPAFVRNLGNGKYELVVISEEAFSGTITLHQASGKRLFKRPISGIVGRNSHPIDLSGFASGLYIITITTPVNQTSIKLINH
ncbi:MAG: heparinase II/III family protein, partial [Bacteroidales bacterium]|nr:heparinase II/III family protein [Bacteroidales bacterium]